MANKTLTVAMIGFSAIERTHVSCICKLSQALSNRSTLAQQPCFQVADRANAQDADILLVDADNAIALRSWSWIKASHPSIPAILINDEPVDTGDLLEMSLARRHLPDLLLRSLAEIAQHQQMRVTS